MTNDAAGRSNEARDWKIFRGDTEPHDGLKELPPPPPWRFSWESAALSCPDDDALNLDAESRRARPFKPSPQMILAVNAALYLRRPLLLTGPPGTGKSTLISKVAYELKLGEVIRWPISSSSNVKQGLYEYDAVGRLQAGKNEAPPVEQYLTLGPLGTALTGTVWPRPLLIDEIDKSDLDFANDLLNIIDEGRYGIPELRRLNRDGPVAVRDVLGQKVDILDGEVSSQQFPFVVMTSNAVREFPPPFLRRCIRLEIKPPRPDELLAIVEAHLSEHVDAQDDAVISLVNAFEEKRGESRQLATDQLLNAAFLTLAIPSQKRSFEPDELKEVRKRLLQSLDGGSDD